MRAVLLADTEGANALSGGQTVFDRLVSQLRAFGVTDITVIARPEHHPNRNVTVVESGGVAEDLLALAEYARDNTEPVIVARADLVLAETAASQVLSDPTRRSGALVRAGTPAPGQAPVRLERGLVTSVGTSFHVVTEPNGAAVGLMKVSAPYLDDWRAGLNRLRDDDITTLAPDADAWDLQLLAMARLGNKLTAYQVPGVPYGRARDARTAEELRDEITECDEDAVRLDLCVKRDDDLFATYAISSWSRRLVLLCARLRLTPVAVTWLSILFAVVAAGLFTEASRPAMIGGALAMYVSFVLDCVDGQLARYTHRFTAFGGWLDMIADRAKEYLIYAGLAWGAASAGLTWAWPLAIAAITVQVVRHMIDTWYGTMQDAATLRRAERPLLSATDGFSPAGPANDREGGSLTVRVGRELGRLSALFTSQRRSPSYWFKRTIVFPVGERWLVMALGAALFDGRVALAALLVWQLVAFAYTLAGRTLRSWAAKVPVLAREGDVSTHRDDGLVARYVRSSAPPLVVLGLGLALIAAAWAIVLTTPGFARAAAALACLLFLAMVATADARHDGPLDWLVPAGLRAGEFALITVCGLAGGVPAGLVFALLAVLALYHYDLAARVDKAASPLDSRIYGLGWDGRVAVLLVSLIPGLTVWVFALMTLHIAVVFVGGALLGRRQNGRAKTTTTTPHPVSTTT